VQESATFFRLAKIGWVDLSQPIIVKAGEAFIAIPESTARVAWPNSLCETCQHMREIITPKSSRFLLCQLSVTDARYAKYPRQPVLRCEGHTPGSERA
jgi:hypothetical protein